MIDPCAAMQKASGVKECLGGDTGQSGAIRVQTRSFVCRDTIIRLVHVFGLLCHAGTPCSGDIRWVVVLHGALVTQPDPGARHGANGCLTYYMILFLLVTGLRDAGSMRAAPNNLKLPNLNRREPGLFFKALFRTCVLPDECAYILHKLQPPRNASIAQTGKGGTSVGVGWQHAVSSSCCSVLSGPCCVWFLLYDLTCRLNKCLLETLLHA